jgi:hypothetical protein
MPKDIKGAKRDAEHMDGINGARGSGDPWVSGAQQIERSDEHDTIIREVEESRTSMCSESMRWSTLDAEHGIIWR